MGGTEGRRSLRQRGEAVNYNEEALLQKAQEMKALYEASIDYERNQRKVLQESSRNSRLSIPQLKLHRSSRGEGWVCSTNYKERATKTKETNQGRRTSGRLQRKAEEEENSSESFEGEESEEDKDLPSFSEKTKETRTRLRTSVRFQQKAEEAEASEGEESEEDKELTLSSVKAKETRLRTSVRLQHKAEEEEASEGEESEEDKDLPSLSEKTRETRTRLRTSVRLQQKATEEESSSEASEGEESEDDEDLLTSSENDDDVDMDDDEDGSEKKRRRMEEDEVDLDTAKMTPRVLQHLNARKRITTGRKLEMGLDLGESMSENVMEGYFTALQRISAKKMEEKTVTVMNDARRGKKPRKGTRGLGGRAKDSNVPTLSGLDPNFSVTQECSRVAAASAACLSDAIDRKHAAQTDELLRDVIQVDFDRWMLMMKEGFNVMLYGFGSKRNVFRSFKSYLDEDWLVVTVNGMYPKIHPKKFLVDFCEALELDDKIKFSGVNPEILAEEVLQSLKALRHPDVFLIVKNIDNLAASHPAFLTVICALTQIKWIHMIASTDSINASLGITQGQAVTLNMCWVPCSTFKSYEEELSWNPSVFGEKSSSEGGKNTLQYVLKSLTGNARKAFSILATLQLGKFQGFNKSKNRKDECGVEFRELARKCRENFLAHSDAALNTLLREFIDHKLITQQGKKVNAGSLLCIDLDTETLQDIVNDAL